MTYIFIKYISKENQTQARFPDLRNIYAYYRMNKTKKSKTRSKRRSKSSKVYSKKHYQSNDGMLTTVWGPSTWHLLHTMSFNYPMKPSCDDKENYRNFVLNLVNVLPCGKCRENLKNNFKRLPLTMKQMESRNTFSKYVYKLHEAVNTMLKKKSGLSYQDVRERYEHFRARCALGDKPKEKPDETGCVEPIYGEKSKCVLKIIPQTEKCETFQMDEKCIKKRLIQ